MAAIGAGTCLLLAMIVTCVMVFGRYVLHVDLLPGAYNYIERILFPLLVFWAMPLTHREGMFPKLDTVPGMLSPRGRRWLELAVLLIELVIYLVLQWLVIRFVWAALLTNRPMQIGTNFWPMWPVLIMMPLCFGLMILQMIRRIWHLGGRLWSPTATVADI